MTKPSGKSWIAMARLRLAAATGSLAAKATPMARPSGRLCSVTAITNSVVRRSRVGSMPSRPLMKCSCGSQRSIAISAQAPSSTASATCVAAAVGVACARAASRPGMISENEHAASITPAPKPISASCPRADRLRVPKAGSVPKAVAAAASSPACSAIAVTELRPAPAPGVIHVQPCCRSSTAPIRRIVNPNA